MPCIPLYVPVGLRGAIITMIVLLLLAVLSNVCIDFTLYGCFMIPHMSLFPLSFSLLHVLVVMVAFMATW